MGFKTQTKKVIGCTECRLHAVCMYCLGLLPRPKKFVRCMEPANGGPCILNKGHDSAPNPTGHCFWT